jgi:dihydropteroate synthase-like protein
VKVLLVTGALAQDAVRCYAKESDVETEVLVLGVAVAAFLTPQTVADALRNVDLGCFNLILVPGLVRGDTSVISKVTGVASFKGPRYAADLPLILDSLCEVELSTILPADELLREKLLEQSLLEIRKVERDRDRLLKLPGNILIGGLAVGGSFPMRVLAEIVDAAQMDKDVIQNFARRFVSVGADLIDVGR